VLSSGAAFGPLPLTASGRNPPLRAPQVPPSAHHGRAQLGGGGGAVRKACAPTARQQWRGRALIV